MGAHGSRYDYETTQDPLSQLPQDGSPYKGPVVEYLFVDVPVNMTASHRGVPGISGAETTTDINAYYPLLAQQYAKGFELVQFQMIPGSFSHRAFSTTVTYQFQGIFTKDQIGNSSGWKLHVEHSTVTPHLLKTGLKMIFSHDEIVSDTTHLIGQITDISSKGGRLICLEASMATQAPTAGQVMRGQGQAIGIDVLFHLPMEPSPAKYTYQAVNIPITSHIKVAFPSNVVETNFDWNEQLQGYLSEGWKLVDIFYDNSKSTSAVNNSITRNSVWFFEKEVGRLEDPTPQYEGVVVEYWHRVSYDLLGKMKIKGSWIDAIQEMGRRGWELSCIVSTNDVRVAGVASRTSHSKQLVIFQRKILC